MKAKFKAAGYLLALSLTLPTFGQGYISFASQSTNQVSPESAGNVNTDSKRYFKIKESNTDNGIAYNRAEEGVKYANIQFRDYNANTNEIELMLTFHYQGGNWSHDNREPDSGTINLTFRNPSFTKKIDSVSFPNNTKNNIKNFEAIPDSNKASWRFVIQNLDKYSFSGNTLYSMPIRIKLKEIPTESDRNTILEMTWINRDLKYDPFSESSTIFQSRQAKDTIDISDLWVSSEQPVSGRVVLDAHTNTIKTVHALKPLNSLTDNNSRNQRDNKFYDSNIYLTDKFPKELLPYLDKNVTVYRSTYDGSKYNTYNGYEMTFQDDGTVSTKSNSTIGINNDINQAREALGKDEGAINNQRLTRGPLFARGQNSIEYTFEYKLAPGKTMEEFFLALGELSKQGKAEIYSWQEYQHKDEKPREIKYSRHMSAFTTSDGDQDGLIDDLEKAIGTSIFQEDTDGDGKSDYTEYINEHTDPTNPREFKVSKPTIIKPGGKAMVIPADKPTDFVVDIQTNDHYKVSGERIPVTSSAQAMYNFFRITSDEDIKAIQNGDEKANSLRLGTKSQQDKVIPLEALNNPNGLRFTFDPKAYGLNDGERFIIAFKPMDKRTLRSITDPIYVGSFGILDANGGSFENKTTTNQVRLSNQNGRYTFKLDELVDNKLPIPTRPGYRFLGYSNKKEASPDQIVEASPLRYADQWNDDVVYRVDEQSPLKEASQTAYAIWEKEGYVINFHDNTGKLTQRYNVTDISTVDGKTYINLPKKSTLASITGEGQFRGWADKANQTNPLQTGKEIIAGMSRPIYLYDGASFDVTNKDINKEYDLYAVYEPYIDITAEKSWNNKGEKPGYYVGLVRAEAIGANDNPALNPDITYISNGSYIGFTYVPDSEKPGADKITWENLPAYSPAGRRYSYVILEAEKPGLIPNFNGDWSTANVTIIKTDDGKYNKVQALSLKNNDMIDAYSGATQRVMEYTGGSQASPDTITGYKFKVTNTKEELNRPTIFNIYQGDKEFYFDPNDGAGNLDRIEIEVKDDIVQLSKDASGSWSLDNDNYSFDRLGEDGETTPTGRYFTISLKSGDEFQVGDKVKVTNSLSTSSAKRESIGTAVARPKTLKLEKPVQGQNVDDNVAISTKAPKGTPDGTSYSLEKRNPDGSYTKVDIKANITTDDIGNQRIDFVIPKGEGENQAKSGDVFRVVAETNRFIPTATDDTDPIDTDNPVIEDQNFRFYQYETDKNRLAINIDNNSDDKTIRVLAQNPVDGISIVDNELVLSDAILQTEQSIDLRVKAIDQFGNESDEASLKIEIKRREQAETPKIVQEKIKKPSYDDGFVKISITGEPNEEVKFIYNIDDNYIVNLDKDGKYTGYLPKESIPESGKVRAVGITKDKRDSEEREYKLDKDAPEAIVTKEYIAGTGYIDIGLPDDNTLTEIWIRDDSNSFARYIEKTDGSYKIDGQILEVIDGKLRIPVENTELKSVGTLTFTVLDEYYNARDTKIDVKIDITALEKSLEQANKLDPSNPATEADKELTAAKEKASEIIKSVHEHAIPQPNQDKIDQAKRELDKALANKYRELLAKEVDKANKILESNADKLDPTYEEDLRNARDEGQNVLGGDSKEESLRDAYEKLKELNDNVKYLSGKVTLDPSPKDGDRRIAGTTTPGATVVITLPSGNIVTAKANESTGEFALYSRELKANDVIKLEVREEGKTPRPSEVAVSTNRQKLEKAITDAKAKLIDPAPADENKQDRDLRAAIKAGEEIANNPKASQQEIDDAEKRILAAIKAKETADKDDKLRNDLKDKLEKEIQRAEGILSDDNKDSLDDDYKKDLENKKTEATKDLDYLNNDKELDEDTVKVIREHTDELEKLNDDPIYTSGAIAVNPALRHGDRKITGHAPADSVVTVNLPNGKKIRTFADEEGNFTVTIKDLGLEAGTKVTITAAEPGKKVRSEEFVVEVNKDDLAAAINEASPLVTEPAPENEKIQDQNLRKALENANSVNESTDADQETIDEAERALRDAIAKKDKADKKDNLIDRLNKEISKAEAILTGTDSDSLNSDYKKQLEDAKRKAEEDRDYLVGKEGVAARSEDIIKEDIDKLSQLNENPNYDTGKVLINELKETDTTISGLAPAGSNVTITLPNGNTVTTRAGDDGTYSVEIRQPGLKYGYTIKVVAKDRDRNVSTAEITVKANKDLLNEAIKNGGDLVRDIPEDQKTPADKALEKAIKDGKDLADKDSPSQDEVNQATDAINKAIDHKKDTDSLKEKIEDARTYLPDEKIQQAIDNANKVIEENGGKDAIDKAKRDIEEAINSKKDTDKQKLISQLKEEIRRAGEILENDKNKPLEPSYKIKLEDSQLQAQTDLDYLNGVSGLKDRTNSDIQRDIEALKALNDNPQYKGQSGEINLKENPVDGLQVIEGTAPANSALTVELPAGVSIKTKADENGNFTINLPAPLKQGEDIRIIAEEEGKLPTTKEIKVGANKKALDEAIKTGEEAISQTTGDRTPADDKLQKAIDAAKEAKVSEDVDQNTVDQKTQDIYDALREKENRDELKDLIRDAKDKVTSDNTPVDNKLITTINEATNTLNNKDATEKEIQQAKERLREAIADKLALSNERIIPFVATDLNDPANPADQAIPNVDQNGNKIDRNDYIVVGFRTDGKGKINGKHSVSFLVRKGMTFEELMPNLDISGNDPDTAFWKWNETDSPELTGEITDGYSSTARFITSGQRISSSDVLPENYHKVTINRKTSVSGSPLFGRVYAVKDGNTLAADKFPQNLSAADGYAKAHWIDYNTKEQIADPSSIVINEDRYFLAQANKRRFDPNLRLELISTRLAGRNALDIKVDKDTTKVIATINGSETVIYDNLELKAGSDYELVLNRQLERGDILSISLENKNNNTYSTHYEWTVRR